MGTWEPTSSSGGGGFSGGTVTGATTFTAPVTISPASSGDVPLKLLPVAGATASGTDMIEIYDDASNVIGYWDARGNVEMDAAAGASNVTMNLIAAKGLGKAQFFATGNAGAAFDPNATTSYFQAAAGQRARISVFGAGTPPLEVAADAVIIRTASEPADATLSTSEMALWLDATNGAAKLMVKAKQANGVVVTAAVALA